MNEFGADDPVRTEALLARVREPLAAYFRGRAGPDSAEDMVQDAYVEILGALPGYRPGRCFLAFALAIAKSTMDSRLRVSARDRRRELLVEAVPDFASDERGPGERVLATLDLAFLRWVLAQLPPPSRAVLVCCAVFECTTAEAADRIGLSRGSAAALRSWAVRRARAIAARGHSQAGAAHPGGAAVTRFSMPGLGPVGRRLALDDDGLLCDLLVHAVRVGQVPERTGLLGAALDKIASQVHYDAVSGSLFEGVPAVESVVRIALRNAPAFEGRHSSLLRELAAEVDRLVRSRLRTARARAFGLHQPSSREFSLSGGLAGLGAVLLHRDPHGDLLSSVVAYLVGLTEERRHGGLARPGWWTGAGPDDTADLGIMHGAAGILAVLSLARLQGVLVAGMDRAIWSLVDVYQAHRHTGEDGAPWWPSRAGSVAPHRHSARSRPAPGWDGTLGICRSLHLAAQAIDAPGLRQDAAHAARAALANPVFPPYGGIRSGPHGAAIVALRIAEDDDDRDLARTAAQLLDTVPATALHVGRGGGFLTGAAGTVLARRPGTNRPALPSSARWDFFLAATV